MDLECGSGRVIRDATSDDVRAHLETEVFTILSAAPESYIQCVRGAALPHEFALEYRNGSKDDHYSATDDLIPFDRVLSAFLSYLKGDPTWRSGFRWEKTDLD